MRRLSLHIAVAVIAFVVGLTTAAIFGVSFTSRTNSYETYVAPPRHMKMRSRSCRMPAPPPPAPEILGELPSPPEAPAAPEAPLPAAAPKSTKSVRVVVRRPDGTLQVVESQAGEHADFQLRQ